jgi:hippurate hydrolase
MASEDFAFFLERKPGAYVWIGNGSAASGGLLHNPHYDFNDAVLPIGASYWVELAERVLAKERATPSRRVAE